VVVCEFANPTSPVFRTIYRRYLVGALPQLARVVSSSAPAYRYLADSILAWPDRAEHRRVGSGRGLPRGDGQGPGPGHRGRAPRLPGLIRDQARPLQLA
jgi:demethylmenaquinone methyltransferase / 2-methoxy-6-polyprenyl-1,4-benzoquinol methylase